MDKHTIIGLGKKMGESHAHCSCGWSISGSAGGVGRALTKHLYGEEYTVPLSNTWCRRAALPFTGRTS